jgi:hypothetical protein
MIQFPILEIIFDAKLHLQQQQPKYQQTKESGWKTTYLSLFLISSQPADYFQVMDAFT